MKRSLLLVSSLVTGSHSFQTVTTTPGVVVVVSSLRTQIYSTPYTPKEGEDLQPEEEMEVEQQQQAQQQLYHSSQALPWMKCPEVLRDCDWAGNAGFDPLCLAATKEQLWHHREAEIKHARLAMLAAAGLPLSDLFDREVDAFFGIRFLESDAWHHILTRIAPVWWGACLGLAAAVDMYGAAVQFRPENHIPGQELHLDPFGLYPADAKQQKRVCELELQHGRVAMLAMAVYLLQEYNFMTPGSTTLWDALWQALEEW